MVVRDVEGKDLLTALLPRDASGSGISAPAFIALLQHPQRFLPGVAERWESCSCVVLEQPGCYGNGAGQRVLLLKRGSGSLGPLEGPWESSALPLAPRRRT